MTMKEVIETELKCVQRDCCRLENECAKCDLVLPKEEIVNAYNEALKLEEENKIAKMQDNEIEQLKKQNKELKEELTKKTDTNHSLVEQMADLESENAELKAQIEKMKCCENCRHYSRTYGHCYSYSSYQNCKSLSNWRLDE